MFINNLCSGGFFALSGSAFASPNPATEPIAFGKTQKSPFRESESGNSIKKGKRDL